MMAIVGLHKLFIAGLIVVSLGLAACSMPKGMKMAQLQGQYEDIGRVSARAIQCGMTVPVHFEALTVHAKRNGATDKEAESLVSYHDAAMRQGRNNKEICMPDERLRVQKDLETKMKALEPS